MKIAIATDGDYVASHFGRCPEYTLVTVEEGKVQESIKIQNPGHEPGFLPEYLAKKGTNWILAGGMGPRAQQLFAEKNISVCIGVEGKVDEVVRDFLNGNLKTGESHCSH